MNILHAKSSWYHTPVWRHGARRRYCSGCGRSWTLRKRRRGRKRKRYNGRELTRYFKDGVRRVSAYRLRKDMEYFLRHSSWPAVPGGRLIVVAEGAESYTGWRMHFATLPPSIDRRLVAAVCDGRVGLIALVRERSLILQRCHFHLLARIQMKRSKLPSSFHYQEGVRLYHLARAALTAPEPAARAALRELAAEVRRAPRGLRTVLSGFVVNYRDYRTYRLYPFLQLPRTTGSAESLTSSIRELLRQLRGVRTQAALERWLNAYNESLAQEFFPLTEDEARVKRYPWRGPVERTPQITLSSDHLPATSKEAHDSLVNEVIECAHGGECAHQCTKGFRMIAEELQMYKSASLPLPRLCPNCRHFERLAKRNPLHLWKRRCQCAGTRSDNAIYKNTARVHAPHAQGEHCSNGFETSYAPERPEIVYCESCYNSEVA